MDQKKCQNISLWKMLCCLEQINTFCIQKALNGNCIWTLDNTNITQINAGEESCNEKCHWQWGSAQTAAVAGLKWSEQFGLWSPFTLEAFHWPFFCSWFSRTLDNLSSDSIHCNLLLCRYWSNSYTKVKHFKQIALPCLRWVANPGWLQLDIQTKGISIPTDEIHLHPLIHFISVIQCYLSASLWKYSVKLYLYIMYLLIYSDKKDLDDLDSSHSFPDEKIK